MDYIGALITDFNCDAHDQFVIPSFVTVCRDAMRISIMLISSAELVAAAASEGYFVCSGRFPYLGFASNCLAGKEMSFSKSVAT